MAERFAGLAIALIEPLTNIFGWLFIVWRRFFGVGDRIQIGEMAGDVIDVRVFQFSILEIGNWVESDQSTGRIVHIPNGKISIENLANYTSGLGFIWNEIPLNITLESDWRTAKNRMLEMIERNASRWGEGAKETIKKVSNRFLIFYSALKPTVFTSVGLYSATLTLRYLFDLRQRRISEAEISVEILK